MRIDVAERLNPLIEPFLTEKCGAENLIADHILFVEPLQRRGRLARAIPVLQVQPQTGERRQQRATAGLASDRLGEDLLRSLGLAPALEEIDEVLGNSWPVIGQDHRLAVAFLGKVNRAFPLERLAEKLNKRNRPGLLAERFPQIRDGALGIEILKLDQSPQCQGVGIL